MDRWTATAALALALAGCSNGSSPDPDGGAQGCAPIGAPGAYRCPAGCSEWTGKRIDTAEGCTTEDAVVLTCWPNEAMVIGDAAIACYQHSEEPSVVVWSGSTTIAITGVSDDRLADTGWVRCSDLDAEALLVECPSL